MTERTQDVEGLEAEVQGALRTLFHAAMDSSEGKDPGAIHDCFATVEDHIRALRSERDEGQGELGFTLNDLRTARDRASRAEAALSRQEAALREAERRQWINGDYCGPCGQKRGEGHREDCPFSALASEPGQEGGDDG